jgi:hypothetical protein
VQVADCIWQGNEKIVDSGTIHCWCSL